MADDKVHWRAVLYTVLDFLFPQIAGNSRPAKLLSPSQEGVYLGESFNWLVKIVSISGVWH
jgi:hypothetical protein